MAEDSSGLPVKNLRLFGKSTQVTTTGANIINGMDGLYESETSEIKHYLWGYSLSQNPLMLEKKLSPGTYTFTVYTDTPPTLYLGKKPYVTGNYIEINIVNKDNNDKVDGLQRYWKTFEITDECDMVGIYSTDYKKCFGGMLVEGDKLLQYEPYTEGKPSPSIEYPQEITIPGSKRFLDVNLSDEDGTEKRQLTLSTPNGLPGIPATSGGNYTDENGQQWVCDEIDLARGKYVQRVKETVFCDDVEKRWQLQTINEYGIANFQVILTGAKKTDPSEFVISNFQKQYDMIANTTKEGAYVNAYPFLFIRIKKERADTIDKFRDWLTENAITIVYELADPIEHNLPPEVIEQFKRLKTYYPTTIVRTDEDVNLELEYTADIQSYVDMKIAEISTAIVQKGI